MGTGKKKLIQKYKEMSIIAKQLVAQIMWQRARAAQCGKNAGAFVLLIFPFFKLSIHRPAHGCTTLACSTSNQNHTYFYSSKSSSSSSSTPASPAASTTTTNNTTTTSQTSTETYSQLI